MPLQHPRVGDCSALVENVSSTALLMLAHTGWEPGELGAVSPTVDFLLLDSPAVITLGKVPGNGLVSSGVQLPLNVP